MLPPDAVHPVLVAIMRTALVTLVLIAINAALAFAVLRRRFLRNRSPRVQTMPWEQAREHIICKHCGGIHSCDCPRILKRNERRYPDGSEESFVEYSPNISGELWADVVWPEDAPPEASA